MKRIAALLVALAAAVASAQQMPKDLQPPPSERWFSITRSSTGFLAGGNLAGTLWAFHVRGADFKWLGAGSPPMFAIDGVVMQVKAVPRSSITVDVPSVLQAHKRSEQQYQARTTKGVTFGDHDMCRNAKLPHQHWTAQASPDASGKAGLTQAYVTFEVGDYILMIVAPYENERRREAVATAIDDLCRSFTREKVS